MNFGGLVSKVEHRISKNGKPWGKFTLEDFHGSHEFTLFGEDYINMKDYMVEEWMVMVMGSVQRRRVWKDTVGDPGSEFRLSEISMLADSKKKRLERVRISLNLTSLDSSWIDKLEHAIKESPGNVGLTLDVYDGESKVVMPSRAAKIDVTNSFLSELDEICAPGVAKYRFDLRKVR